MDIEVDDSPSAEISESQSAQSDDVPFLFGAFLLCYRAWEGNDNDEFRVEMVKDGIKHILTWC
jgi:hypothetical protein